MGQFRVIKQLAKLWILRYVSLFLCLCYFIFVILFTFNTFYINNWNVKRFDFTYGNTNETEKGDNAGKLEYVYVMEVLQNSMKNKKKVQKDHQSLIRKLF